MTGPIDTAMVLAAGHGTRMRPITETRPKALVEVGGKPLIDHALDRLKAAGIARIVVNIHAFADMMRAHLERRDDLDIIISDESDKLLETGGAIKRALPLLGNKPILTHNCDSMWVEGMGTNIPRLIDAWDPETMDALLMVAVTANIVGDVGRGDFLMAADGRLERREARSVAPFMYTGVQIIDPKLYRDMPGEHFSTNKVWDGCLERGRLFGLRLDGVWMHVGTPAALEDAEQFLREL